MALRNLRLESTLSSCNFCFRFPPSPLHSIPSKVSRPSLQINVFKLRVKNDARFAILHLSLKFFFWFCNAWLSTTYGAGYLATLLQGNHGIIRSTISINHRCPIYSWRRARERIEAGHTHATLKRFRRVHFDSQPGLPSSHDFPSRRRCISTKKVHSFKSPHGQISFFFFHSFLLAIFISMRVCPRDHQSSSNYHKKNQGLDHVSPLDKG